MAAVEAAYLGKRPPHTGSWERRGITAAINFVELMTAFGGYSELMHAPRDKVVLASLVLLGRQRAQEKQARDANGSAGGAGGDGHRTITTSSYSAGYGDDD